MYGSLSSQKTNFSSLFTQITQLYYNSDITILKKEGETERRKGRRRKRGQGQLENMNIFQSQDSDSSPMTIITSFNMQFSQAGGRERNCKYEGGLANSC